MTIDEIKQALRETKKICSNIVDCDDCPFSVGQIKHCPVTNPYGDALPPCEWHLNWPEDAPIDKLRKRYPEGFDPERSRNREGEK